MYNVINKRDFKYLNGKLRRNGEQIVNTMNNMQLDKINDIIDEIVDTLLEMRKIQIHQRDKLYPHLKVVKANMMSSYRWEIESISREIEKLFHVIPESNYEGLFILGEALSFVTDAITITSLMED